MFLRQKFGYKNKENCFCVRQKREIFSGTNHFVYAESCLQILCKLARLIAVYMGNVHSENLKFKDNKFELN